MPARALGAGRGRRAKGHAVRRPDGAARLMCEQALPAVVVGRLHTLEAFHRADAERALRPAKAKSTAIRPYRAVASGGRRCARAVRSAAERRSCARCDHVPVSRLSYQAGNRHSPGLRGDRYQCPTLAAGARRRLACLSASWRAAEQRALSAPDSLTKLDATCASWKVVYGWRKGRRGSDVSSQVPRCPPEFDGALRQYPRRPRSSRCAGMPSAGELSAVRRLPALSGGGAGVRAR
jgi:hypothetical protein